MRGLQPLCGIGVTSLIEVIIYPIAWRDLRADSLPEPGPETSTFKDLRPNSFALFPTSSAAIWGAYGVDLREPLKPLWPADDQAKALPFSSAIVIIGLLKEDTTCATPDVTFFWSLI